MKNLKWKTDQSIEELIEELQTIDSNCIDLSDLPVSEKFQYEIECMESYPIWTVNDNGDCLVGADAKDIESIAEIKNYYENRDKR